MKKTNRSKVVFLVFSLALFVIIGAILMFAPFVKVQVDGKDVATMDGEFFYAEDFIYEAYNNMDAGAMSNYTTFHICDYLFLASYCLLMMSLTLLVTDDETKWAAMIFPLLPALFDVVENSLIETLTSQYPYLNDTIVKIVPLITSMKWVLGVMWFAVFSVLAVRKIALCIGRKQ